MIAYIDQHRDRYGVEPICRLLPIAPSTYHAAKRRLPSARAVQSASRELTHAQQAHRGSALTGMHLHRQLLGPST